MQTAAPPRPWRQNRLPAAVKMARLLLVLPLLIGGPAVAGEDEVLQTAQAIEARLGVRLGLAVLDSKGQTTLAYRADERFAMNSTFKALACAAALEGGEAVLEARSPIRKEDILSYAPVTRERIGDSLSTRSLCAITLKTSDNTAANLILKTIGGPETLTAFLRSHGDRVTRLDRIEPAVNEARPGDVRDTTTPHAMAETIRQLTIGGGLSSAASRQLEAWMAADAVADGLLRKHLPKGWRIADKTGAGGHGSRGIVALIRPTDADPVVVAIYMTGKEHPLTTRDAAIAQLGQTVFEALQP